MKVTPREKGEHKFVYDFTTSLVACGYEERRTAARRLADAQI